MISVMLLLSHLHSHLPPHSDEAGCHVVIDPVKNPTRQGTKGGLWTLASRELRPSAQHPIRNQIPATIMWVNLEMYTSLYMFLFPRSDEWLKAAVFLGMLQPFLLYMGIIDDGKQAHATHMPGTSWHSIGILNNLVKFQEIHHPLRGQEFSKGRITVSKLKVSCSPGEILSFSPLLPNVKKQPTCVDSYEDLLGSLRRRDNMWAHYWNPTY